MKTVLVSGASGIVGYGILKSLRKSKRDLRLIGTSIFEDSVAEGFCDIFVKALPSNSKDYIPWLITILKKYKVDMLIPGIDIDMYTWAENLEILESEGSKVLINNQELVSICKDKWEFYQRLRKTNNPYCIPSSLSNHFDDLTNEFGLPLLLKPRYGFGSKGIVRVFDKATFLENREGMGTILMAQPLIGDDETEYTSSAFCDGDGGFFAFMTFKRKLSKDGFTEKAIVEDVVGMEEALRSLCEVFKPIGPTNFQFRLDKGKLRLLEINPRISSSTSLRSSFGYNESVMAVEFFLFHTPITQPNILEGRAVRYVEDFIFYK